MVQLSGMYAGGGGGYYIFIRLRREYGQSKMFVLSGIKHRTVHSIVAVRLVYAGRETSGNATLLTQAINQPAYTQSYHTQPRLSEQECQNLYLRDVRQS